MMSNVYTEKVGTALVVTINRPEVRNAVDAPTASALAQAFRDFDGDDTLAVAVLAGAGGTFCSGADLTAISDNTRIPRIAEDGDAPLGVSRLLLTKPACRR